VCLAATCDKLLEVSACQDEKGFWCQPWGLSSAQRLRQLNEAQLSQPRKLPTSMSAKLEQFQIGAH
jgi:hypothetical protein